MNIAVTGSTGFIGSALMKQLVKDRSLNLFPFDKNIHSLSSIDSLKNFVKNIDMFIHLAGVTDSLENCLMINTMGTACLLEAISLYGKPQIPFIFSSSFAVYEEEITEKKLDERTSKTLPRNYYGISKLFAEELLTFYNRKYKLPTRILRIANPYGPSNSKRNTSVISLLIDKIYKREPITINGDGTQTRDFIYIDDVVQAFTNTLIYKKNSLLINVCRGKKIQLMEMVRKIESLLGKKAKIRYNKHHAEKGYWIGNPQKALEQIGFRATVDIDEGLRKTVRWYLAEKK